MFIHNNPILLSIKTMNLQIGIWMEKLEKVWKIKACFQSIQEKELVFSNFVFSKEGKLGLPHTPIY
jgi:hypothetical protein